MINFSSSACDSTSEILLTGAAQRAENMPHLSRPFLRGGDGFLRINLRVARPALTKSEEDIGQ